ncbi:MAG: hypothetical protein J7J99_07755 [Thermoprotei archaeon]|nr:hypothetical protein [Thermoprotei archaeon]
MADVTLAQQVSINYLRKLYGRTKISQVRFTRIWFTTYGTRDVWEVEGTVVIKRGVLAKETRSFRLQLDPLTGRIIGFEI